MSNAMDLKNGDEEWFLRCALSDAVESTGFSVSAFRASLAKHGLIICSFDDAMVCRAMEHIPGCDHDDMVSALEAALGLPITDTREGRPS